MNHIDELVTLNSDQLEDRYQWIDWRAGPEEIVNDLSDSISLEKDMGLSISERAIVHKL